jgi:hypothetical protein
VYAGGFFTQIGSVWRLHLAKLSGSGTGTVDPIWDPSPDSGVTALALNSAGALLVGGEFSEAGGETRSGFAAFNTEQAFTQGFDDVSLLAGSGWFIRNNSSPLGADSWYQGIPTDASPDPGPFDAYDGAANSYIAAGFGATTGTGTISDWLGTPNRVLRNGDVFQFRTRKPAIGVGQTDRPDRLEVRLSTNGASTDVGTDASDVGDFDTVMLSINPDLVVGGYPQEWTQYTITMSGLPEPTTGRLAFRYDVTDGGPSGPNSDYVGIDNVVYTPYVCPAITITPEALPNAIWRQPYTQSLGLAGGLGAASFAITAGNPPFGMVLGADGTLSGSTLMAGTFNFTVSASDTSACSDSHAYAFTVDPVVPDAPLYAGAVAHDAQATVSWIGPLGNGGSPITGYTATCSDGSSSVSVSATVGPISVTGLVNGTTYTCTATASNAVGPSPASAPSNAVTPMGNQTITFGAQAGHDFIPNATFPIDPLASASSGLEVAYGSSTTGVCTVSGTTVTMVAQGTCTITADQPGNAAWNPAPQVAQSLTIAPPTVAEDVIFEDGFESPPLR